VLFRFRMASVCTDYNLFLRPAQCVHENENENENETGTHVSFCTRATARPNLFHENANETDTQHNMQNNGISPHCKQKSILSINTLSSITDHVTKEECRTASRHPPKGIAAHYSALYLQHRIKRMTKTIIK